MNQNEKSVRQYPIMGGPSIPWAVIAPCESQAQKNHGQTLTRLAERGGLGPSEAVAILDSHRWVAMTDKDALARLDVIVKERFYLVEFERITAENQSLREKVDGLERKLVETNPILRAENETLRQRIQSLEQERDRYKQLFNEKVNELAGSQEFVRLYKETAQERDGLKAELDSKFSCFRCSDGLTPLYCLNCAETMMGSKNLALREALEKFRPRIGAWENECLICGATTKVGDVPHTKNCIFAEGKALSAASQEPHCPKCQPMRDAVQAVLNRELSRLSSDANSANHEDIKFLRGLLQEPPCATPQQGQDKLRLDYINSLPQPFTAKFIGGGEWPVHDIEVQTGLLRIDVCGKLQVMHIRDVRFFRDMNCIEHDSETFYSDYEAVTPETELAELRRDKERVDWLEKHGTDEIYIARRKDETLWWPKNANGYYDFNSANRSLRQALDSVRRQEKE